MRSESCVRMSTLAAERARLEALYLDLVDGMAQAEAERNRKQITLALEYASGKPLAEIAAAHHCRLAEPGRCAKKWGVRLRLAGARWTRA